MERNRGWTSGRPAGRRLALVAVGLVALGACNGESEGAVPLRTAPPTSAEPTTTTAAPTPETTRAQATTVAPRVTTTVSPRAPVLVEGVPQVRATPGRAAVGARVHVQGYGFTDEQWKAPGASLWLTASPTGCALYASAEHTVRVTADGHLSGEFVVPTEGDCRQSSTGQVPVTAGTYGIAYSCTACFVGTFVVI